MKRITEPIRIFYNPRRKAGVGWVFILFTDLGNFSELPSNGLARSSFITLGKPTVLIEKDALTELHAFPLAGRVVVIINLVNISFVKMPKVEKQRSCLVRNWIGDNEIQIIDNVIKRQVQFSYLYLNVFFKFTGCSCNFVMRFEGTS